MIEELAANSRAVALSGAPTPVEGDGRTVEIQIARWDHPERVSDDGRIFYTEQFARGGVRVMPGARVMVRLDHNPADFPGLDFTGDKIAGVAQGAVVGELVGTHARGDGLYGTIRLRDTTSAAFARSLLDPDDPIIDRLSIEFDDVYRPIRAGDTVVRSDARLTGLVFTLNPQRGDARVLAVRSTIQETPMDETPAPVAPPAPSDDTTAPQTAPASTVPQTQVARSVVRPGEIAATGYDHELTQALQTLRQFPTFGHYCRARARSGEGAWSGPLYDALQTATLHGVERRRARFARSFEDATTADIAGLLQTQWLNEVIDLYMVLAPTVANWSTSPLPEKGMTVSQPIVGDRPAPAVQTNQLDQPNSNKVTVTASSWSVLTYAGGQGMSIQAIERSEPSYVELVMRLYVKEMARARNAAAATVLLAHADDVNTTGLEYVDAETFPDLIVDASADFLYVLGQPAEVVGLSIPLWKALGKAKDADDRYMFPDIAGMNVVGTFDATSPQGQIRRISYYVEPAWGNTDIKGVVGIRDAFRTITGPVQTITADVPTELSRDIAVYQYAAHGKADAAGLRLIHNNT